MLELQQDTERVWGGDQNSGQMLDLDLCAVA